MQTHKNINLFHIMLVFPGLLFISHRILTRTPIDHRLGYLIIAISLVGMVFHTQKYIQ